MDQLFNKLIYSILLVVALSFWPTVYGSAVWSYTNNNTSPAHWVTSYAMCGGKTQSPIDIKIEDTTFDSHLLPVNLFLKTGVNLSALQYDVLNNGHTVKISFPSDTWFVSLRNDQTEQYEVVQMHFHFGSTNDVGSEHTLQGKPVSLESHLVTYNKMMYDNPSSATDGPNGLAVLGFLSQVESGVSQEQTQFGVLGELTTVLQRLQIVDSTEKIAAFDLRDIMKQVDPAAYYRYEGSLTTPPCTENVLWTVFKRVVPAMNEQLSLLRNLGFSDAEAKPKMSDNFRPTLSVNPEDTVIPRVVYRSWNGSIGLHSKWWLISISILITAFKQLL